MDPVAGQLILEGAKLGLQIFFTNMALAGKTEEEINTLFLVEKGKFEHNRPENLPDV